MPEPTTTELDPLLIDAIDLHVHTAPDLIDRYASDVILAKEAIEADMRGILVKSHVVPTAGRVNLVNEAVGQDILLGGLVLNGSVGGLNHDAAEVALELGASVVWLPTVWSANHAQQARNAGTERFVGLRIPDADEEIPVATDNGVTMMTQAIIDLVAEYDAVLGTGHASLEEIEAVVEACAEADVRCLVNHPFFRVVDIPFESQRALTERGAVMEYCAYSVQSTSGHSVSRVANAIEMLGPENCVLATDFGQTDNPPVRGLAEFAQQIINEGVPEQTVRRTITDVPASILDL